VHCTRWGSLSLACVQGGCSVVAGDVTGNWRHRLASLTSFAGRARASDGGARCSLGRIRSAAAARPVTLTGVYDHSGDLYDLTYDHKDYAAESAWVTATVRARNPEARTLLDVACGPGLHLEHLTREFTCTGLELHDQFVAAAAERTGVPVHQGDMDAFELGERFDVVVNLFSAIGYSRDLDAAVASMARHLAPGGLLVVEPWFSVEQWNEGHVHVLDQERDGTRLLRMTHSRLDGTTSILDTHYLVADADGVRHWAELHRMTLFSRAEYESAFRAAGLTVELDEPGPFGRGAYLGVAPSEHN
jgi:dTDP-3-amino-3,6-dideoxy-alpha-D-glucopyranose N,N-dimethyltransferase/dTDP-3-amino-3,4,6-trideoxy-alpha-D-glucopyranose N,N-dimethyltransferase/N-methyltransferase